MQKGNGIQLNDKKISKYCEHNVPYADNILKAIKNLKLKHFFYLFYYIVRIQR